MPRKAMEPESVDRLKEATRALRDARDSDKPLDMHTWATMCGTAACAIGWIARDPWFAERGFHLSKARDEPITGAVPVYAPVPTRRWENWKAVQVFFGIDEATAQELFNFHRYRGDEEEDREKGPITFDEVIGRIDDFLLRRTLPKRGS